MTYERTGWLEVVLTERFGHEWCIYHTDRDLVLKLQNAEGAIVFDRLEECFSQARSDLPFALWDAEAEGWQSVLGGPLPAPGAACLPKPLVELNGGDYLLHYDVLGLTYWMLARVEEIGRTDLDSLGRFPATSSHAYKHDYLNRPLVDEWLHVLGQVIQRKWPGVALKQHQSKVVVSHDVDRPFQYLYASAKDITRQVLGDLIKRKNPRLAVTRYLTWRAVRGGDLVRDPFNTFEWIMDLSEKHGLRSAFYFICGRTSDEMDADYEIDQPVMRDLLRRIHERGHEIGLHPSYETYKKPALIRQEFARLLRVCEEEDIAQGAWGGRMHYLRWEQPTTMRAWNEVGLAYDSSLVYADHAGFRCGTCHAYPAFDGANDCQLSLRIIPLIIMDQLLLTERSGGCDDAIVQFVADVKRKVDMVGGILTILWHNSSLDGNKGLYSELLRVAASSG